MSKKYFKNISFKRLNHLFLLFFFFVLLLIFSFLFSSSVKAQESLYYIHQDHLSSTNLVTNKDGEAVSKQNYYPYGSTRNKLGDTPTERQYTSQVSDQDQTGLYYYNARYYDPRVGVFTQSDPLGVLNKYTYVDNNPINLVDPSGNDGEPWQVVKDGFANALWFTPWTFPFRAGYELVKSDNYSMFSRDLAKANIPIISDIALMDSIFSERMADHILNSQDRSVGENLKNSAVVGALGGYELLAVGAAYYTGKVGISVITDRFSTVSSPGQVVYAGGTTGRETGIIVKELAAKGHIVRIYGSNKKLLGQTWGKIIDIFSTGPNNNAAVALHEEGHVRLGHTMPGATERISSAFAKAGYSQPGRLAYSWKELQADVYAIYSMDIRGLRSHPSYGLITTHYSGRLQELKNLGYFPPSFFQMVSKMIEKGVTGE